MDYITDDIRDAVEKEYEEAIARFPMFHSPHEAIAIIAEECEEAAEEMKHIEAHLRLAWDLIKQNNIRSFEQIDMLEAIAERLAIEACQVAAMCIKTRESSESWKGFTDHV